MARKCCAGVTISSMSQVATSLKRPVASMAGSSATPGRKTSLRWVSLMAGIVSGSCAQSSTSRPARRAVMASAVPHAPAPIMPTD